MTKEAQHPNLGTNQDDAEIPALSPEDGWELLDKQARLYLGMDAQEFLDKWEAGGFGEDPDDDPAVTQVATMLLFARPDDHV